MIPGVIASGYRRAASVDPGEGHKFWRMTVTQLQSNTLLDLNELKFYSLDGEISMAEALATASSAFSGLPPENLIDGSTDTIYASQPGLPIWVQVEFPQDEKVVGISFHGRYSIRLPKTFNVGWSDDGVDFTDILAVSDVDLIDAYAWVDFPFSTAKPTVAASYFSYRGTGPRNYSIQISTNFEFSPNGSAYLGRLIDGSTTRIDLFFRSDTPDGGHIEFDFTDPVIIDEFKWYQSGGADQGQWKVQAFDGTAFVDVTAPFTLGGTPISTTLVGSTIKSSVYRLTKVSGVTNNTI